jgi:hypothetical protein
MKSETLSKLHPKQWYACALLLGDHNKKMGDNETDAITIN